MGSLQSCIHIYTSAEGLVAFVGFTAALVDDAFGAIVYKLKQEGVIDTAPSFTVHLEVDYHKPIPAGGMFCCTTQITSIEGRKSWAKAIVEVCVSDLARLQILTHVCTCISSVMSGLLRRSQ